MARLQKGPGARGQDDRVNDGRKLLTILTAVEARIAEVAKVEDIEPAISRKALS